MSDMDFGNRGYLRELKVGVLLAGGHRRLGPRWAVVCGEVAGMLDVMDAMVARGELDGVEAEKQLGGLGGVVPAGSALGKVVSVAGEKTRRPTEAEARGGGLAPPLGRKSFENDKL
jgi:hypothetical protein